MKKYTLLFCLFFGWISIGAQLSEIGKINREVDKRQSVLWKKYKKEFPKEREAEQQAIDDYRRNEYAKAIAVLQKNEVKMDLDSIPKETLTKEAEYETGMQGFRRLFSENFDTSSMIDSSGTLESWVKFLVQKDGKVSNVRAEGDSENFNQEAIITFYRIIDKGTWKPAEKDGVPVQSVYRFPIKMTFQ